MCSSDLAEAAATLDAAADVGLGVAADGVLGVVGSAVYHSFTPWCPRHAPCLLAAVEYVPSLQSPVDPAGGVVWAIAHCAPTSPIATAIKRIAVFINTPVDRNCGPGYRKILRHTLRAVIHNHVNRWGKMPKSSPKRATNCPLCGIVQKID